jgi:putative ATPase
VLNALEIAVLTTEPDSAGTRHIDLHAVEESIQRKAVVYDRDGDQHYDTISAFIKSLRGSNPDAALYWLAKMLYAGEDPRFIARRMVIAAAEDVGNADPRALAVATAAFQAVEFVGMPEAQIPLAQAVTYIATAPKSNASYVGLNRAMKDVKAQRTQEVPKHLRDASYAGAKKLGHGEGYKYAHDYPGHVVEQEYMPEGRTYYEPSNQGFEAQIARRMKYWMARLARSKEAGT